MLQVLLGDFDISKNGEQRLLATTQTAQATALSGTPAYMAPELMFTDLTDAKGKCNNACDVTYQRPSTFGLIRKQAPARYCAPACQPGLCDFLRRMLEPEPAKSDCR